MPIIIEEITFSNGAKLKIFKGNKKQYIPSPQSIEKIKNVKLRKNLQPFEKRIQIAKRNNLLMSKGICISGNKFFDKILKMHEVFDFTKTKL